MKKLFFILFTFILFSCAKEVAYQYDNQSRIYSDLLDMKNKGDRLIRETVRKAEIESKNNRTLKKIECNTALDAYYSQQAQAELKYMNDMNIIFRKWS